MDSGRESILKMGRERVREWEGQQGHHGFLCRGGWRRGRSGGGQGGGNKLCYRSGSQRCRGASGVLGAVFFSFFLSYAFMHSHITSAVQVNCKCFSVENIYWLRKKSIELIQIRCAKCSGSRHTTWKFGKLGDTSKWIKKMFFKKVTPFKRGINSH